MTEHQQAMTRCPKCNHQQLGQEECEACGLLFRRFERVQDRKLEPTVNRQDDSAPQDTGLRSRLVSALVLVALTASLTYYFVGSGLQPKATSPPPSVTGPAAEKAAPSPLPPPARTPQSQSSPVSTPPPFSGSPIEHAKNATVAIETPSGKGSGFFISETAIVTNKHVVAPDRTHLDEIRHNLATRRKLITLEQEKIEDLRRRLAKMEDGPSRRQLSIIIQEGEKQLARILPEQRAEEARLKEMERPIATSDIKIFLADGSEHVAQGARISPERDLAILSILSANPTILRPAPKGMVLNQGDKVYTVGNPVGLRNTVTAGVFSGYRQHTETKEVLLQTDASINPGNSGGPLIDERGLVHGVNTMILRDTQGIGFAIPIQTVIEEFSLNPN